MPSASSAKPEKQPSTEVASSESSTSNSNQQNTPIRQAIVIIEHKIRNLDKRKAKLETYRQLRENGKDLNQDQKVAVEKYDEVLQTLEFAKDLCKQFHNIVTLSEKEAKKVARKEEIARRQQDLAKIREVVLLQDALLQMGAENVREDFLLGRNGAVTISPEDLQLLDDLYPIISPKHAAENEEGSPDFAAQVQQAAEHLLAVVDARPKEFSGSTFAHVKEVVDTIHNCGYLEKVAVTVENVEEVIPEPVQEEFTPVIEHPDVVIPEVDRIPDQMPPMPNFPPVPEQIVQQVVPEPQFYNPPQPQPRPINEMLETGSFFFLQESEIDTPPEIIPPHAQLNPSLPIPSQTFTNQNFVPNAVPPMNTFVPPTSLPPPIPMPPSHVTVPINPPAAYLPEKPSFNQDFEVTTEHKNGDDDWSEQTEERPRRNNNNNGNRNRSGVGGGNGGGGYYANNFYSNNGYGNNGYKSRGGGNRQSGGSGNRANGPGGNKGGGQYNRSKPTTQH